MALNIERACLNKNRYATKEDAIYAFQRYQKSTRGKKGSKTKNQKKKQIPYKCDHCNGWHLKSI